MNFILSQRLHWQDLNPHGSPFQHPEDIRILHNDWPYGIDTRIVHLVIWTRFAMEDNTTTGDMTPRSRKLLEDYVDRIFGSRVGPKNV
jgi:hypothetical protein